MMDHMRQHDWCSVRPGGAFVDEVDLDNCVTERILRNKFYDPMISSDEEPVVPIDWEAIFKKKKNKERNYKFIPGFHKPPPHPKLSALTYQEHNQCIKVLCVENPHVMPGETIQRPSKFDLRVYEELKEKYAKEMKEYIEWAKSVWVTANCIRALRPKPIIENIYEAEFKIKMHMIQPFPKTYTMAAQIPIRTDNENCEIVLPKKDLIEVNILQLPLVEYPQIIDKKLVILQALPLPEPCNKHPCKFKLPNERTESILPLTEVHNGLAQYALDNGSQFIASENALKCLLELNRNWTLPISVCEVIDPDGERMNVVVLGSEVPARKELAVPRAYRAYRHVLERAFTDLESRAKTISKEDQDSENSPEQVGQRNNTEMQFRSENTIKKSIDKHSLETPSPNINRNSFQSRNVSRRSSDMRLRSDSLNCSSDEDINLSNFIGLQMSCDESDDSSDDDRLLIDIAEDIKENKASKVKRERHATNISDISQSTRKKPNMNLPPECHTPMDHNIEIGLLSCVCKGTEFETPRPRSFRKWKIKNKNNKEEYDIIIHCSHKLRNGNSDEVILEPILEYQLDIGGTLQSQDKLKSLVLSLMLRKNANLINVRLDAVGGEVVTIENLKYEDFKTIHGDLTAAVADTLHTTLAQLAGLLPGRYLLQHEMSHGSVAMLYSAGGSVTVLTGAAPLEREEAKHVQQPPNLGPVLLPIHKVRRQLPCAFTTVERLVAKEPQKPPTRQKLPPKALTWPKKKKRKNKK